METIKKEEKKKKEKGRRWINYKDLKKKESDGHRLWKRRIKEKDKKRRQMEEGGRKGWRDRRRKRRWIIHSFIQAISIASLKFATTKKRSRHNTDNLSKFPAEAPQLTVM